jgi:hypothetical protein
MLVQLHLNRQKGNLSHELCLQRTSMEDERKYLTSAESPESTVIHPKVMRITHPKVFPTPKNGLTGMVIWTTTTRAMTNDRQMINPT